jgi:hypothetical protein
MDRAEDNIVTNIFHGAQANKFHNGIRMEVSQGITASYDPAILACMVCENEHNVTNEKQGVSQQPWFFSDQN